MENSKPYLAAALALAALSLAACDRHAGVQRSASADPSAVVIGTTPAAPTGDPPGTTPVDAGTSDVSKPVEQNSMPLPGQPNDHSNEADQPSQKAQTGGVNSTAPNSESPNSGNSASPGAKK